MKLLIIIMLALLASCNQQSASDSQASKISSPSDALHHYSVTILGSGASEFSGEMCGQHFDGAAFECDTNRFDVKVTSNDFNDYRLIIESDGITVFDETIHPRNQPQTIQFKDREVVNE